mgnify:CR=1 FL=1
MFTLGIPLKQKRRTLGYLSNEYFPGGMKKLGQQVPYEIISTDREGGFFVISFPDMGEDEFRSITFQLKQQGVTVIGADSQLTEKTMKLVNLVPLKENRLSPPGGFTGKLVKQLVQADKDTMFFANGKYYVAENEFQDFIEDFQVMDRDGYGDYIDFKDIEFAEGGAIRPQFIPGLNEGRVNGPFNYKTLSNIARKDDSALAFVGGKRIIESGFFVSLELDGFDPNDSESFFGLKEDGESVEVRYDEVEFVETSIVDEGSCGYAPEGEDPNEAEQPAGPHLIRKKIREMIEAYVDNPDVPGTTGMEDAVNDPSAKAEKILMQLAKSFPDIPLSKVINDSTYKRQAVTQILFGMMN